MTEQRIIRAIALYIFLNSVWVTAERYYCKIPNYEISIDKPFGIFGFHTIYFNRVEEKDGQ